MKKASDKKTLREIPMFSELTGEQLEEVAAQSSQISLKKHLQLFMEGEKYRGFYILLEGSIKVFRISNEGRETIIHLVKPKQVFADIPLFEGTDYPVSAEALIDSVLIFFNAGDFTALLEKNPQISLKMLAGFAKRMKSLTQKIEELSSKEVTSRLAKFILQEINSSGTGNLPEPFIKLSVSKTAVAGYIGTITETLSRSLKKLQDDEIIRVQGKKVFVTNIKKLKELSA
jgi:CRP-like cAMP-binding protein